MYPTEDLLRELTSIRAPLTNEDVTPQLNAESLVKIIDALTEYFNYKQKLFMGGMSNPGMGSGQG